jgi:hypothetical protein
MAHDTGEERDYICSKFKDMTCVQNYCTGCFSKLLSILVERYAIEKVHGSM